MITIREYQDARGNSPFDEWFARLDSDAAKKVSTALYRLGLGNMSNTKSVGAGVHEFRINFGPGYRLYFGNESDTVIILLGGGSKRRQESDILDARERWSDYQRRRKQKKKGE